MSDHGDLGYFSRAGAPVTGDTYVTWACPSPEGVCAMARGKSFGWRLTVGAVLLVLPVVGLLKPGTVSAQQNAGPPDVTFAKDIAPILQRSCQNCHRSDGVAPMSLVTYEEVRPWARSIKQRTGVGPRAGVMPPWYVEKNIGIQHYKDDPSLSDAEVAKIGTWSDNGAPQGNPADAPPPAKFSDLGAWNIGEPDL